VTSNDGIVGCPSSCVDAVMSGATVTLTATPSSQATFSGWSGGCTGSQLTCTLTLSADTSADASFGVASASGNGNGSSSDQSGGQSGGGGGEVDVITLGGLAILAVYLGYLRRIRPQLNRSDVRRRSPAG
jgi:hypothetical protein